MHVNLAERTTELLQAVEQRMRETAGPGFVVVDFNSTQERLAILKHWEAMGWSQDIAQTRHGIEPQETCKAKTRKDFVYVSPELLFSVQSRVPSSLIILQLQQGLIFVSMRGVSLCR